MKRLKLPGEGFYHVVSRIGGRRFLLDAEEKGRLWSCISRAAAFSGVELLSWAIMDNHFHLLVRVPERRDVSDAELQRRMLALYGKSKLAAVKDKWASWARRGNDRLVLDEMARLRNRMYDLSQFCKTFKEEYSQDYNRRHENTGSIWEGRFKSILIEGTRRALSTVSSYIHLNPVRAGVARKPEDAQWTSYGAACRGNEAGISALCSLAARAFGGKVRTWDAARARFSEILAGRIVEEPVSAREQFGRKRADPVLEKFFPVPDGAEEMAAPVDFPSLLRSRVVPFLHGSAIGGIEFLSKVARLMPPRRRRRLRVVLDNCVIPDLTSLTGVRTRA